MPNCLLIKRLRTFISVLKGSTKTLISWSDARGSPNTQKDLQELAIALLNVKSAPDEQWLQVFPSNIESSFSSFKYFLMKSFDLKLFLFQSCTAEARNKARTLSPPPNISLVNVFNSETRLTLVFFRLLNEFAKL